MKRLVILALLALSAASPLILAGCTVYHAYKDGVIR